MNIIHCAAHNNHVSILQFVNESLDGFKLDAVDKVLPSPLSLTTYPAPQTHLMQGAFYSLQLRMTRHHYTLRPIGGMWRLLKNCCL